MWTINLVESLHSSRFVDDKQLRIDMAVLKDMMDQNQITCFLGPYSASVSEWPDQERGFSGRSSVWVLFMLNIRSVFRGIFMVVSRK